MKSVMSLLDKLKYNQHETKTSPHIITLSEWLFILILISSVFLVENRNLLNFVIAPIQLLYTKY